MSATRSVIIITYGRTGSTLLVGLLNTARGALIRGENGNFFFRLFKAYQTLLKTRRRGGNQPNHPFFGAREADTDGFLDLCRQSVNTVLAPKGSLTRAAPTTIGFKEIRYLDMPQKVLDNYLDFLTEIFPDPLFVFLTRDIEQVMSSGFYAKRENKEALSRNLQRCHRKFAKLAEARPNTFQIDYKDLADGARLRALFDAAGLAYDEKRIRKTLQVDHSPQTPDHLKKKNRGGDEG